MPVIRRSFRGIDPRRLPVASTKANVFSWDSNRVYASDRFVASNHGLLGQTTVVYALLNLRYSTVSARTSLFDTKLLRMTNDDITWRNYVRAIRTRSLSNRMPFPTADPCTF